KFNGKSDEGFFVGYLMNSDGPKWLFDIDVLTKPMNYVPVVASTNSNDFVGIEESIGAGRAVNEPDERERSSFTALGVGHSSKEIRSSKDYILMPLWKDGSLFDSSSKNASNDEPQPSSDARKKEDACVSKENGNNDQERPENSTQDVNTAGPKVNMSNITTTYIVPSTPNTRIHKDHSLDHVIGDVQSGVQTRRMTKTTNEQGFISAVYEGKTHEDLHTCMFTCFLSQEEPKRIAKALSDSAWVEAMQEELLQNKKDERGIVIRNKARLVAQGHTQEEGIDYDDVFAPVARNEAIRLFLAYASFMGFMVYQMDMKSAFLYGRIKEEVYVCQPLGFEDPDNLEKVYKVVKALYGLHQAPRACYETLAKSMLMTLSLALQRSCVLNVRTASTLMDTEKTLLKDLDGDDVYINLYMSMIRLLMYLTSSRPDIMFAYPRDSSFDLVAYSDSDYARASLDRKSTTGVWQTATAKTLDNGEIELTATIDGKVKTVTEGSVRRHLQLADDDVESLETDLKQTKLIYGDAYAWLIKKVKKLEKTGRKIAAMYQDLGISLVQHDAEIQGRYGHDMEFDFDFDAAKKVSTASAAVTTASVAVSTASPTRNTGVSTTVDITMVETLVCISGRVQQKTKQLKGYSFDEIKTLFEITMRSVDTFVPIESEVDRAVPELAARSLKRVAKEELDQESSKRQKTGESSELAEEPRDKEADELSQEELQQMMIIVPEQGINVEALQTKYPIIDWEIYTEGTRKYWKIIRVGNHTEVHHFFDDMLKAFDRDDLVMLWSLVKEKFNSTEPTDDKEREIWVELKRLFEPDIDDELWKHQKHIQDLT
ncbi:putative reverse transcriptase, RNA-dependent DNA polymerase, partial [Tanacetum coccineum]